MFVWLLLPLRQHQSTIAKCVLLCLLLFGVLDYGYKYHDCDLLWWRRQMVLPEISSLSVGLWVVGGTVFMILAHVLGSYIRSVAVNKQVEPNQSSSVYVKRRYCRFLMMELLVSLDDLLLEPECIYLNERLKRHDAIRAAVQHFRCQALKVFELTDQEILRPLHEVLHVDDELEAELIRQGYAAGLGALQEQDIERLVHF